MSTSIHLLSTTYTDIHLYRCMSGEHATVHREAAREAKLSNEHINPPVVYHLHWHTPIQVSMPQFIERQLEKNRSTNYKLVQIHGTAMLNWHGILHHSKCTML